MIIFIFSQSFRIAELFNLFLFFSIFLRYKGDLRSISEYFFPSPLEMNGTDLSKNYLPGKLSPLIPFSYIIKFLYVDQVPTVTETSIVVSDPCSIYTV